MSPEPSCSSENEDYGIQQEENLGIIYSGVSQGLVEEAFLQVKSYSLFNTEHETDKAGAARLEAEVLCSLCPLSHSEVR